MLTTGYSSDHKTICRVKTRKLPRNYFNEVALMAPKYLDKWIGTVTC